MQQALAQPASTTVNYTNLRSTDVERYTPKFLKNWETQHFQKYLGIRLASDTKAAPLGFAEVSASPNFSAGCIFHLHSAGVGSRRLHTNMQPFGCKLV